MTHLEHAATDAGFDGAKRFTQAFRNLRLREGGKEGELDGLALFRVELLHGSVDQLAGVIGSSRFERTVLFKLGEDFSLALSVLLQPSPAPAGAQVVNGAVARKGHGPGHRFAA